MQNCCAPPTYSGYLSTFKDTGRSRGPLLAATMRGVTLSENQGEQPQGITVCSPDGN
jgi:hypothetical protein